MVVVAATVVRRRESKRGWEAMEVKKEGGIKNLRFVSWLSWLRLQSR